MYNLGLDISSSKIGIAVIDKNDDIVISEVIKLKSNMPLEERAAKFEQRMREIDNHYVIYNVYVEEPALMFKGGKTTAQTMAKLQRFNGMCCYILFNIFDACPTMINPRTARAKVGIKIPRKTNAKTFIIDWVSARYEGKFKYEKTSHGNPRPGTDDRADAIIVALAGAILDNY
jgi:hypothetical protein